MERKKNKQSKLKVRKGDMVEVITGNSKGKQGRILEVFLKENRAIVEGANIVSKHAKPSASNPNGGITKKEAAIHVSNIMLVDSKSGKTTRIGKKLNADGKFVRIAKRSGEEIK